MQGGEEGERTLGHTDSQTSQMMEETKGGATVDSINHPPHYAELKPEPIDVIESWALGFHLGNCVKYIARAGRKNVETRLQDLQKASWYLNREIERFQK